MSFDVMCSPGHAKAINESYERYLREWGYLDDEPLRTKKYRRAYRKRSLRDQIRTRPLPLP